MMGKQLDKAKRVRQAPIRKANKATLSKMSNADRSSIRRRATRGFSSLPTPEATAREIKKVAAQKGAFTTSPGANIEVAREGKSLGRAALTITKIKATLHDIKKSYLDSIAKRVGKLGTGDSK